MTKKTSKIISWNVNGIRAAVKKGFAETLEKINPDILCLQETKAQADQVREAFFAIEKYDGNRDENHNYNDSKK